MSDEPHPMTLAIRLENLRAELYWAQRHAADLTMAEHNRKHFEREAERLRAEIAKALEEEPSSNHCARCVEPAQGSAGEFRFCDDCNSEIDRDDE